VNNNYPWDLAAKIKSPIPCAQHSDYGWCEVQDNGDHIPLSDLKKVCTCEFLWLPSASCVVDQHRHSAALESAKRARRDRFTRWVTRLSEAEWQILSHERCECGHERGVHNRLWGRCLHDFGEVGACACQRFASDAMTLFSLDEQLNVDVHW
jgi:hypothetical protein